MAARTHIGARDLAALNLPSLPATPQGISKRASRDGWSHVDAGAGRLYAIADLPAAARDALAGNKVDAASIRPGRPKGSDFFSANPDVADAVEAIISERQLAVTRVQELLGERFAVLPSYRTLKRFVDRLETEKAALLASVRDPDTYNSQYRLALGTADGGVTYAHQVWELDTTPADIMTKRGRKAILGVIDRWSRRARFLVADSESGQSVRRLLTDTIRAWGVMPTTVATDNGSGYINVSIRSALEILGIEHFICPPGTPQKKPFIERVFGTFTRERAELLPGFIGHNVAQAQRLRGAARKKSGRAEIIAELEPEELQAVLDAWVDGVYHQRTHGTLGMSPMKKWLSSPVPATAAPGEDVLRIALSAYVGPALVGKRGVQWKRGRYWSATLAPWIGRQVILRRDEEDLGALLVFDEDGRFIDTAVNAERKGVSQEAMAAEATRNQRAWMTAQRAELRAKQRAFDTDAAIQSLLRRDAEAAGKVIALPTPTERRTTNAIDSIANAPTPALPDPARIAQAVAGTAPKAVPQTTRERVAWADKVINAAERGERHDADELSRARLYATTTEYRAHKMVAADFAPAPAQPAIHDRRKA